MEKKRQDECSLNAEAHVFCRRIHDWSRTGWNFKIIIMEQEIKDPDLWHIAQKRAGFKYHVLIYFIMNLFFWTLWYISLRNNPLPPSKETSFPGRYGQWLDGE